MSVRLSAVLALVGAGVLWGLSVPLTKLVLGWLDPAWLTVVRFALAAPILAWVGRRELRAAWSWKVGSAGAIGFGVVVLVQNLGVARTSVSHGALIIGALPALVALAAFALRRGSAGPRAWTGFGVALAGIGLFAGAAGGTATLAGDALVLASVALSALFVVGQASLLVGRDPVAVTAIQMTAAATIALPFALIFGSAPSLSAPPSDEVFIALGALVVLGSLIPFTLYAYAQARVEPEVAGAFLNLEPLVGLALGAIAFDEPFGPRQMAGTAFVLVGLALSSLPSRAPAQAADPRYFPDGGSPARA